MGLSINTNVSAINSYRNLSSTQSDLSRSLEKLSSGFRINRAADDAAGLAISEGLRSQIGGLKVAARNAQDGVSVVQTAEGGLTESHAILQRLRDLAVQGANDSNNTQARANIKTEADNLIQELGRMSESINFNGTKLLDGGVSQGVTAGDPFQLKFQVGANGNAASNITINLAGANLNAVASNLGLAADGTVAATGTVTAAAGAVPSSIDAFDVSDAESAQATINTIDTQIAAVSTARANLGSYQNRFEHTIKTINVSVENLSASESRIRDTDMAQEMVSFTRAQILSQAGTAMLAQANQMPQSVLSLIR